MKYRANKVINNKITDFVEKIATIVRFYICKNVKLAYEVFYHPSITFYSWFQNKNPDTGNNIGG